MNEGAVRQHGVIGEGILKPAQLSLHGELHHARLAGLHWRSQRIDLVAQPLVVLGELRPGYLNRGLIILVQREMDFGQRLRGLVHDGLLAVHGHVPRFGIQVDGIFHVRDPRLGLLLELLVSLFVIRQQAVAVIFTSYRVQDFGVVEDPAAGGDKADRSRDSHKTYSPVKRNRAFRIRLRQLVSRPRCHSRMLAAARKTQNAVQYNMNQAQLLMNGAYPKKSE